MRTSFPEQVAGRVLSELGAANREFLQHYPGESDRRQPVHTVYGGAHLFRSDSAARLGREALRSLETYAPEASSLARVLDLPSSIASILYERVVEKLRREPVEDFRLDFEDGYGNRVDEEEDGHAVSAAAEVARGCEAGSLPPFIGIRIKPFNEDLKARSIRTLDLFLSALLAATGGRLPENFVVTLPKVVIAEQVEALVRLFEEIENANGLSPGTLKLELMIETPQSIFDHHGHATIPKLIAAGAGRCTGAHFGVYDYTAACNIMAGYQAMGHAACDFARQMMLVTLAGTGIHISDGATNILPVGPHRADGESPLSEAQEQENTAAVHQAWRMAYRDNQHSLENGFCQGWDLHPGQFVVRYAAIFNFFLSGLRAASARLKAFVEKAALASLHGDVFDDAATGQGLLNFFLRGINCGAITEQEATATGLTVDELRSRSFLKILQGRRE